jgi:hypothetical protein
MGHVIRRAPIHLMLHASVTSATNLHYHNLLKVRMVAVNMHPYGREGGPL